MLSEEEYLQKWLDAYVQARHPESMVAPSFLMLLQDFLVKCGSNGTHSFRKSIDALAESMSKLVGYEKLRVFRSDLKMVAIVEKMAMFARVRTQFPIPLAHQEKEWTEASVKRIMRRVNLFSNVLDQLRENRTIMVPYSSYNTHIVEAIQRGDKNRTKDLVYERLNAYTQYAHGFSWVLEQDHLPNLPQLRLAPTMARSISLKPHEYTSFSFAPEDKEVTFLVPRLL